MISFAPTDDQKLMIDASQKLAKTLASRIRETEKSGLSEDLRVAAQEMGLGVAHLPESAGGAGLGLVTAVLLEEEIASGDPAAAFALGGTAGFGLALTELGSAEQSKDVASTVGAVAFGEARPHKDRAGLSTLFAKTASSPARNRTSSTPIARSASSCSRRSTRRRAGDGIGAFLVEKGERRSR